MHAYSNPKDGHVPRTKKILHPINNDNNKNDLAQLRNTPQHVVDLVYDTLECLHRVLTENNIPYTIFGGTALGAARHGGLIPWDDDGDTAILADNEQRLVDLANTFAKNGFTLVRESSFGYRLYHTTLTRPRAYDQYPYPFLDIFVLNDTGSSYEYITEESRTFWPQTPLPYGCFNRLIDVKFGHLTLRGLSDDDMKHHLDDNYGKDWSDVAWREFDHFYYGNVTDLHIKIEDQNGRRAALHSKHQRPEILSQPVAKHNISL